VGAGGVAALSLLHIYHRIYQPKSKYEQCNYDRSSKAIHLHSLLELAAVLMLRGDQF
jgi:hypothetical protein